MTKKYILNLANHARELHAYLKVFYLGPDHPVADDVLLACMEELLLNLANNVIADSRHSKMPQGTYPDEVTSFEIYGEKTQIDSKKASDILLSTILLDNLLDRIYNIVKDNNWGMYVIEKDVLYFLGDFRIVEWEREHLDESGNYVK